MRDWRITIEEILEPLRLLGRRFAEGFEGCSEAEVEIVESHLGHPLPAAVKALYQQVGRSRGGLFPGADFGLPEVLEFRATAAALLGDLKEEMTLHPADFVFLMEQGYQFFFLRCGVSEDPPVFFYNDDDPGFVSLDLPFTGWLRQVVAEEAALWRRREG